MSTVFVVGAGAVTPAGLTRRSTFDCLLQGVSKVRRITSFDPARFKSQICATVEDLRIRQGVHDRHIEMALRAVDEAVLEAEMTVDSPRVRTGIVFATAIAGTIRMEQGYRDRFKVGMDGFLFDTATELLADRLGAHDLTMTVTTGCTASIDALGMAFEAIRQGIVERAYVVGAEAPISPITLAAFDRIGAISRFRGEPHQASRPFHPERDGFVLSEGAAAVVLESEQLVRSRGAKPIARIEGWASVSSAYHMTSIRSTGEDIARAMRAALADAKCAPEAVDFLDLHATSTKQNDFAESAAVAEVFGARIADLPVVAQKSVNGHALGASNLLEIVSAISALERGVLPPVANLDRQDPACGVLASNAPVTGSWKRFLKNASGFSGIHSSVVIGSA